jgi:hypothetical protein
MAVEGPEYLESLRGLSPASEKAIGQERRYRFDGEMAMKCPKCGTEVPVSVLTTRLAEYGFLERRTQNDSRICYGLVTALMATSWALLSVSFNLFDKVPGGESQGTYESIIRAIPAIGGLILLYFALGVQSRFNDTGNIRRARAIQIEKEVGFSSFTLFEPWKRFQEGYYDVLGELAKESWWNRLPHVKNDIHRRGVEEYKRINKEPRISKYSRAITVVLWVIGALALFLLVRTLK